MKIRILIPVIFVAVSVSSIVNAREATSKAFQCAFLSDSGEEVMHREVVAAPTVVRAIAKAAATYLVLNGDDMVSKEEFNNPPPLAHGWQSVVDEVRCTQVRH